MNSLATVYDYQAEVDYNNRQTLEMISKMFPQANISPHISTLIKVSDAMYSVRNSIHQVGEVITHVMGDSATVEVKNRYSKDKLDYPEAEVIE